MCDPDGGPVRPVVEVYPAAAVEALEGRSALLCVAAHMRPPLVSFSWKRRLTAGPEEEEAPADEEELQLREPHRITSIRLVGGDAARSYQYRCSVQHEGGTVDAPAEQGADVLFLLQHWLAALFLTVLLFQRLDQRLHPPSPG